MSSAAQMTAATVRLVAAEARVTPRGEAATRAGLVGQWFAWLDRERIAWVAVGDDQAIADGASNDVDLLVAPAQLRVIPGLVRRFARAHRLRLIQDIQHEAVARFFVLAWDEPDGRPGFLYLDIAGDYWRHGRRFLPVAPLLRRRVRGQAPSAAGGMLGYWRPAPPDNLLYYLLKKVDKGTLPEGACATLAREWRRDPAGARDILSRYLPPAAIELFAQAIASGDWQGVQRALPGLRAHLAASPRLGPPAIIAEAVRRLLRCCRPTGLAVQVDEPAAAEEIARDWAQAFRRVVVVRLDRPPGPLRRLLLIWPQVIASTLVVFASSAGTVPGALRLASSARRRNRTLGVHLARRQAAGGGGRYLSWPV